MLSPPRRRGRRDEIFFSFLLRGQKGKNFRYPTGNNLAEGQSWFKQSRFSGDCLSALNFSYPGCPRNFGRIIPLKDEKIVEG
jgi:hypothetical protein